MRPCSSKQGPVTCSLPRDPNPPGQRCPAAGPCSSGTSLSPLPVPSRRAPAPAAGPLRVDTFRRPPVTLRSLQKSNPFPVLIVLCPAGFSCSLKNTPFNVGATFCLKFLWQVKDPSMPIQTIGLRKNCPPPSFFPSFPPSLPLKWSLGPEPPQGSPGRRQGQPGESCGI